MYINYLEAQASITDERQLHKQSHMLQQKSAHDTSSAAIIRGHDTKPLADDHEYNGHLHGESDQNPFSRCHRMPSEH